MKRSKTDTIIFALEVLAREVQSGDGIANEALLEAAIRMSELQSLLREASGPMSYGHWSSAFRKKVARAVAADTKRRLP